MTKQNGTDLKESALKFFRLFRLLFKPYAPDGLGWSEWQEFDVKSTRPIEEFKGLPETRS